MNFHTIANIWTRYPTEISLIVSLACLIISIVISLYIYKKSKIDQNKQHEISNNKQNLILKHVQMQFPMFNENKEPNNEIFIQKQNITIIIADIDHDGENELIIITPCGVHGSQLSAYKIDVDNQDKNPFVYLDALSSQVPFAFSVEDHPLGTLIHYLDIAIDKNFDPIGLYTDGYRDEFWYYIEDGKFKQFLK